MTAPNSTTHFIDFLPSDLSERVRVVRGSDGCDRSTAHTGRGQQTFVLLWLHHALRIEDNPALNVAVLAANQQNVALLVYQVVSECEPFASDRHHVFVLQGARDLARQCASAGLPYCCHVERDMDRRDHLATLAAKASLVVTDDFPTGPARERTQRLADDGATVWAVDSACVVPMTQTTKAYDRAFAFRRATQKVRDARMESAWKPPALAVSADVGELIDFDPVDVRHVDLADLIATCDIDHAVGPIPHTIGGTAAARERWRGFRDNGLLDYAARRNDALVDGVSRMSAYLHYGMISAFELARDAESYGDGGEKYLDELLIWRELAYHFCHHRPDHESIAGLPEWAVETLREHETDSRPATYDWETLSRGQTGDPLWDAAQQSLRIHGELHNNVRMTWGKALLGWTPSVERCLELLIDLNHRYALDGRDPASYGGLLWCLGQFDRPFAPEQSVIGVVRPRDTATHARRLSPERYAEKTGRPLKERMPTVAVVGGGVCGLTAARTLADHGVSVTVFDRGRRAGGRLASREMSSVCHGDRHLVDHGAPAFEVTSPRFERVVAAWMEQGLVAEWQPARGRATGDGAIEPITDPSQVDVAECLFVGQPSSNAIAQHLAAGLRRETEAVVSRIAVESSRIEIHHDADDGATNFDRVVIAMPPEQARRLIPGGSVVLDDAWPTSRPTHVALVSLKRPAPTECDVIDVDHPVIERLICESRKPGRFHAVTEHWTVQTTKEWSAERLEDDRDSLAQLLGSLFCELMSIDTVHLDSCQVQRWTFAFPNEHRHHFSAFGDRICVTGDWAAGGGVEGAFLAGQNVAGAILRAELIPTGVI